MGGQNLNSKCYLFTQTLRSDFLEASCFSRPSSLASNGFNAADNEIGVAASFELLDIVPQLSDVDADDVVAGLWEVMEMVLRFVDGSTVADVRLDSGRTEAEGKYGELDNVEVAFKFEKPIGRLASSDCLVLLFGT